MRLANCLPGSTTPRPTPPPGTRRYRRPGGGISEFMLRHAHPSTSSCFDKLSMRRLERRLTLRQAQGEEFVGVRPVPTILILSLSKDEERADKLTLRQTHASTSSG